VLLIGDSITRNYYPAVEEKLKDRAFVARIATSKAIGDPALVAELAVFLSQAKFDVIHFNIGMHGWTYSEDDYRKGLPALIDTIRKGAPGAKLIWAHTTPVRKDRENGPTNARIVARNAIAKEVAVAEQIPIDDLYTLMLPLSDFFADDVHFNKGGSARMAEQVAASIEKALQR
jgi:lysophospholipase L1-like esterase